MEKKTIISIVLSILLLFAIVQAFQLNSLKTAISAGKVSLGSKSFVTTTGSSSPSSSSSSSSTPASTSVSDLPAMVGGC